MEKKIALIAGVTGITGGNLATLLAAQPDWTVYGISRKNVEIPGVTSIGVDLRDREAVDKAVSLLGTTHAFFGTWMRQANELESTKVNGQILENFLDALSSSPLQHAALVTGGKHYVGSFEEFGKYDVITPFREEQPRKSGLNFYYTQEDVLFDRSARYGFNWAVHRPDTIIGYALGNAMNLGVTLAVYASICRHTGRPFVFPGSPQQYTCLTDVTDARILASQMLWAATTPEAANQAFNVCNGDLFRWDWLWAKLAAWFDLEVAPYPGHAQSLAEQMEDIAPIWDQIVAQHDLKPNHVDDLASWWHTDIDTGRPFEVIADLTKSRLLGFQDFTPTTQSFYDLFARLRNERIIP